MNDGAFGTLMSALDNPLIVVTTAEAGERAGCLVGFHTQSSIDPQRYCVWLSKANHTYRVGLHSSHLAIHFLSAADLPLAELFGTLTGDTVDKFAGLRVSPGAGGAPVLADCPNWLVARRLRAARRGRRPRVRDQRAGGRGIPAGRSSRSAAVGWSASPRDMRPGNVTIRLPNEPLPADAPAPPRSRPWLLRRRGPVPGVQDPVHEVRAVPAQYLGRTGAPHGIGAARPRVGPAGVGTALVAVGPLRGRCTGSRWPGPPRPASPRRPPSRPSAWRS